MLAQRTNGKVRQFDKFAVSKIGLEVKELPTEAEWKEFGELLNDVGGAFQWLLGDWLVYGERKWGKTYEECAARFGYEVATLYNIASVARRVEFSLRRETLEFGHHEVIAALDADDQRYWLARAADEKLTVAALRKLVRGVDDEDDAGSDFPAYDLLKRKLRLFEQVSRQELLPHDGTERRLMLELLDDHVKLMLSLRDWIAAKG